MKGRKGRQKVGCPSLSCNDFLSSSEVMGFLPTGLRDGADSWLWLLLARWCEKRLTTVTW